ncbi:MAG: hypothetical protein CVU94_08320 [Firmicutes bacterium HGW-Firmicutes-19]|nr:MAG: hypothetical protein CVU94_08320 [Firmicutes bacterium HGW-Firmicutes-19]
MNSKLRNFVVSQTIKYKIYIEDESIAAEDMLISRLQILTMNALSNKRNISIRRIDSNIVKEYILNV